MMADNEFDGSDADDLDDGDSEEIERFDQREGQQRQSSSRNDNTSPELDNDMGVAAEDNDEAAFSDDF